MSPVTDLMTLGEALLSLRASGPLSAGADLTASVAGAEANVAIALARLGHTAAWIGRVGDDESGALVARTLRGEGVDVHAAVGPGPTGILLRRERVPGVVSVDYHRRDSAGSCLEETDVLPHLEDPLPRWLHVTGVTTALSATARSAVTQAVATARSRGVRVSLDVNHRSRLWPADTARDVLAPLARQVDVVIASEDELPLIASGPAELLDAGARIVAVKRGAAGAILYGREGMRLERRAVHVDARDVVGAGDAFCAGLLSGLLDDLDPAGCLDRALLLGAFCVSTHGDWEGLPTRAELGLLALGDGSVVR